MAIEFRKVCNPLLPSASEICAYLETPDRTRWYANRGQLVCTLETRLSRYFGAASDAPDVVITTATGTAALNTSYVFDKVSVFFDFGTDGASGGGGTFYCDDLDMAP